MFNLLQGNRSEDFHVDQGRAREDARSLLQAGKNSCYILVLKLLFISWSKEQSISRDMAFLN